MTYLGAKIHVRKVSCGGDVADVDCGVAESFLQKYPRRESNPDQQFRKLLFYPLNYRDRPLNGINK